MRSEHPAFGIFRTKALHDLAPQQTGRPHLGDFEIKVHPDGPEKRQSTGKSIHIQALGHGGFHIFFAICQGEGQLQGLVGASLLHVVARYGYRVELGHVLSGVSNDVPNDAHARLWRIDIGVAHHELFEDVVLDRATELLELDALLLCSHDVTGQHGQNCAIHRHGNRHLVQRNLIEQNFHVLDRIDGHTRLAHIPRHAGVVRVVTAVGGQVKCHRHALPPCGQGLSIKRVRFLRRRKTSVLPNGPRSDGIHGGLGAAHIRGKPRQGVGMGQALHVFGRVQGLDRDAIGGAPIQIFQAAAGRRFGGGLFPLRNARFTVGF